MYYLKGLSFMNSLIDLCVNKFQFHSISAYPILIHHTGTHKGHKFYIIPFSLDDAKPTRSLENRDPNYNSLLYQCSVFITEQKRRQYRKTKQQPRSINSALATKIKDQESNIVYLYNKKQGNCTETDSEQEINDLQNVKRLSHITIAQTYKSC